MRYRLLGNSGLRVSEAALGTMTFGEDWGWGSAQDEARKVYDAFREDERPLANAVFPDDINVNHTLVKDGWCWWYRKYGTGRVKAKGLWANPLPVPPWEW